MQARYDSGSVTYLNGVEDWERVQYDVAEEAAHGDRAMSKQRRPPKLLRSSVAHFIIRSASLANDLCDTAIALQHAITVIPPRNNAAPGLRYPLACVRYC